MSKKDFIDALHVVPESLEDRVFGEIDEIGMPSDEESAILAIGKLSANINNKILKPLSGLDVTELLLRVGQRSNTAIAGLLSGLECIVNAGALEIVSPKADGIYCGWFDDWRCTADGVKSVKVTCGEDSIDLAQDTDNAKLWKAVCPIAIGQYKATFTATPESGEAITQTVNFSVVDWSTFPVRGATYRPEQIDHVSVSAPGAELESVSITLMSESIDLALNAYDEWQAAVSEDTRAALKALVAGSAKMTISAAKMTEGLFESVIEFFIEVAEEVEEI